MLTSLSGFANTLMITTPLPVTGNGTFWKSYPDIGGSVYASGIDGNDFVAFSYYSCDSEGFSGSFLSGSGGCTTALAASFGDIDGIISRNFFVRLGEGSGVLDLYSPSDTLIASAFLSGYVTNVSSVTQPFDHFGDVNGTFAIVASFTADNASGILGSSGTSTTPEPPTWMLMLLVAISVLLVTYRLKQMQRHSSKNKFSKLTGPPNNGTRLLNIGLPNEHE